MKFACDFSATSAPHRARYGWTPHWLFRRNERGAWYDPSDLATLFQDSAGTTAVTAPGDPVGRMLDKSGNGLHATQATAAARPIFTRRPASGRRNMLPNTAMTGAANGKLSAGGVLPAAWNPILNMPTSAVTVIGTGQIGGLDYIDIELNGTPTSAVIGPRFSVNIGIRAVDGETWASRVWLQRIGGSTANITSVKFAQENYTSAGAYASQNNGAELIGDLDTWKARDLAEAKSGATIGNTRLVLNMLTTGAVNITLRIGGLQLERAAAPTAYQRVASGYDVTEAGVADRFGLAFDGVDDVLLTGTLDLTGTNKVTVAAGIAEVSLAAEGYVVNFNDTGWNAFVLKAPTGIAGQIGLAASGTAATVYANESGLISPLRAVLTGTADLTAPLTLLRRNGVQKASTAADPGAGTFGNGPVGIGRKASSSIRYFNGLLHGLVLRGAAPEPYLAQTERFLAGRMGVTS